MKYLTIDKERNFELGSFLREKRRQNGLSRDELLIRLGISKSKLGLVERGEVAISLNLFINYTTALLLDPAEELKLFAGTLTPEMEGGEQLICRNKETTKGLNYQVGTYLKFARKMAGQDKTQLDKIVGVHTASAIEVGRRHIPVITFLDIIRLYGRDPRGALDFILGKV